MSFRIKKMNKLFCLAIVLVAYGPLSVFGDSALQEMGWVVGEMSSTELGPNGQYNCTPAVWNDGVHQYISFTTKTNDLPSKYFLYRKKNNRTTIL